MTRRRKASGDRPPASSATFLRAVPYANEAMRVTPQAGGGALVEVPMRRPKGLIPPLSWLLPYSSTRRVELDAVGAGVLKLCDGHRTVETIVEEFARGHKLSFREAQLPVTVFLQQLERRGLVALVAAKTEALNEG